MDKNPVLHKEGSPGKIPYLRQIHFINPAKGQSIPTPVKMECLKSETWVLCLVKDISVNIDSANFAGKEMQPNYNNLGKSH